MMRRMTVCLIIVAACAAIGVITGGCGGGGAKPFTVAGTVTNASDGTPIAGALVTATVLGSHDVVASTTTSTTGVYGLSLPAAMYVIEATASGFEAAQQVVDITAQPNLSVNFTLTAVGPPPPPPINLGGQVQSTAFVPISGATVTATIQGGALVDTTTTDADGKYGFWLATNKTYVIAVSATGFKPAQQTVTLPLGGSALSVNFTLEPS
jgi:hypothetical protein